MFAVPVRWAGAQAKGYFYTSGEKEKETTTTRKKELAHLVSIPPLPKKNSSGLYHRENIKGKNFGTILRKIFEDCRRIFEKKSMSSKNLVFDLREDSSNDLRRIRPSKKITR